MGKNLYSQKIKVVSQILTLLVAFVLISVSTARGQATITIKGKVTDAETKEAIPEATVAVKGTTNGVHTDLNGDYSIIVGPKATLVFSFLGYTKQEIPVLANQTVINVKLQASQEQLRDVVVTALNIPKEERSIGYSETQIKGATLTEARENSFMNGLEGEVAGVNVSPVATGPNGATNVVIRGITSLTGSSQPLYVLNGIPMVNNNYNTTDVVGGYGGKDGGDGIGDINPDDIATISILKGAAATALYGYRGANGVVLITTKRGTGGDGVGIEFNSNFVWEQVIDNTNFQTEYGQGYNGVKPVSGADALGFQLGRPSGRFGGLPV
jgi:TonB-dependent SusC/RagA subfamily outer membrane receptor